MRREDASDVLSSIRMLPSGVTAIVLYSFFDVAGRDLPFVHMPSRVDRAHGEGWLQFSCSAIWRSEVATWGEARASLAQLHLVGTALCITAPGALVCDVGHARRRLWLHQALPVGVSRNVSVDVHSVLT